MELLLYWVSGAATGLIAGQLMSGGRYGGLGNCAVGVIGASALGAGWTLWSWWIGGQPSWSPAAAALGAVLLLFGLGRRVGGGSGWLRR